MGDTTGISWTDKTFNPWWGCSRISPACRFCYADAQAQRYGHHVWRRHGERRMLSDANWAKPAKWNREAEDAGVPVKVFCASMADVFEDHPQVAEPRKRLWGVIESTPWLRWQVLTKRPENIAAMVPWGNEWPPWVWIGTSVENQRYADERIPLLVEVPAAVRFLSCEPLLSAIDLSRWIGDSVGRVPESGGRRISSSCDGGLGDRLAGPDLASSGEAKQSPEPGGTHRHPVRTAAGGEAVRGLPAGPGDVQLDPVLRASASAGLASLQRPYTAGADREPQERQQGGELAGEPGASDLPRADTPRPARPETWPSRPVGYPECDVQAEHEPSRGDSRQASERRAASGDSGRLRRGIPAGIADRQGRPPIAWLILGGESGGAKRREMDPAWLSAVASQCQAADVAVWVKQDSGPRSGLQGRIPDELWALKQFPAELPAVSA